MQSTSKSAQLAEAKKLADQGKNKEAWDIVEPMMFENPNDALVVMLGAYIMHKSERFSMAYYLAHEALRLGPEHVHCWMEAGMAAKYIWQMEEAKQNYRKAIAMSEDSELKAINYSNLASCFIEEGKFREAEPICQSALKYNPAHRKAQANYGLCLMARGDWSGWDWYKYCNDTPMRKRIQIGTEQEWDGTKGGVVLVCPEQGLGDEVSFASMFPDLIRDSGSVVIECNAKLGGLFRRSFPDAKVYGTRQFGRWGWNEVDMHPDYSISAGELGRFYRRSKEAFPGTPYLVADPDRRTMWRALFDSRKKPTIGIAWTGGLYETGNKLRRLSLEQLLPVFESIDAHWVSLQYKPAGEEIKAFREKYPHIDLVEYPYATLTQDYDDTAALVAELDLVICMQQAVLHLAGALGKECWGLIPRRSLWRYGESGDSMVWYNSVKLIREDRDGWAKPIERVANALRARERKAA